MGRTDARIAAARSAGLSRRHHLLGGMWGNVIGHVDPKTGALKEIPIKTPKSGPHGLTKTRRATSGLPRIRGRTSGNWTQDRQHHRVQDA